jgi:hypothetical protein
MPHRRSSQTYHREQSLRSCWFILLLSRGQESTILFRLAPAGKLQKTSPDGQSFERPVHKAPTHSPISPQSREPWLLDIPVMPMYLTN